MKPEQVDLLRKAEESLAAARLMEQQGCHDFAASRAYYTMFYIAHARNMASRVRRQGGHAR